MISIFLRLWYYDLFVAQSRGRIDWYHSNYPLSLGIGILLQSVMTSALPSSRLIKTGFKLLFQANVRYFTSKNGAFNSLNVEYLKIFGRHLIVSWEGKNENKLNGDGVKIILMGVFSEAVTTTSSKSRALLRNPAKICITWKPFAPLLGPLLNCQIDKISQYESCVVILSWERYKR